MKFSKLELFNFRCFEKHTFELGKGFNLIIGNNAKGKTSLVEALTVGAGSFLNSLPLPVHARDQKSREFKRADIRRKFYLKGQTITAEPQIPCSIRFFANILDENGTWTGGLTTQSVSEPDWKAANFIRDMAMRISDNVLRGSDIVLPILSYYGTERLWLSSNETASETIGPESRFTAYVGCLNSKSNVDRFFQWFKTQELVALQQKTEIRVLEACRNAITTCVPDSTHVYYDVSQDGIILLINNEPVPFEFLSDGYRNMLAMVADIAIRCATLNPHLESDAATKTPGVVMIDEIDLHLHPKWQRQVVRDLMIAFPNIQFVATTHSPFVIQSLPPNKDVKLINLDGGALEDFPNRSVEDIVEWVQGVEQPQRSHRHVEMMKQAEEYFSMLEDDSEATEEARQTKRLELAEAILPFSDDPAYSALIRMQELAKEGNKGNGKSLRRERKPKSDPKSDSDGDQAREGGAQ